jgi:FkbM family methyltransferase
MDNPFQYIQRYNLPSIKSVIQVGASGGQEIPMYFSNGIDYAVMIEPLDYPFSILAANCQNRGNYLPVQMGVGAEDGVVANFYVASNDGQSSSILKPASHLDTFPYVSFDGEVKVNCYTLDTIARSVKSSNPGFPDFYDLIYIDVQGAEREVFKGGSYMLQKAKYIFSEVGYGGGYENDVSYLGLIQYLDAFGFRLVSLDIDPNTGYGDAFFCKKL